MRPILHQVGSWAKKDPFRVSLVKILVLGLTMTKPKTDQDETKGATEESSHGTGINIGLQEQIGHRDQDPLLKDADSDFPEPGLNPEHTGEPEDGQAA